ncbi:uncharacterized protein A1O5_04108 [Cladophialophora psammophila CBS 110553]|uniref:HMG box domain-containing protein n=1 Tax=Cladophialophora psammophila CBS 110553 TaxID=1182543 RepID=W9XRN8_9EURO|nr:uncharacterized protein A1O5_04108 [Cladophialophora psammophila CBS 110553]EXJ72959.1 hypothetical protein A1O5_04108 [Cladophialophora psammophila CBS 110553]
MAEPQPHSAAVRKSSNPRENICLCPASPKIPRPRNSFILFRQHQQASIIAQNPGIPNPEVSKIIGEQWRGLSAEAKEEWNLLAEEEKARHQQQYPGYRYHPRRNGRVSNQSSLSGPPSVEPQDSCTKCGGKPMNYYTNPTPVYTPPLSTTRQPMAVTVPAKRGYVVSAAPPGSRIHGQPALSPEHVTFQRVDSRLVYAVPPPPQTLPTPPSAESQDAKRRRFNSNGVYLPGREVYPEGSYSYAHSPTGGGVYARQEVLQHPPQIPLQHVQVAKPQMVSPPRAAYPRPPQLQPIRPPPPPHQRNRSSVALPPIETMVTQTPVKTPSTQSQSSGVEAMIMSIPVLNKIKVLSQISGPLPAPGVTSPRPEVRGAIIAVEGMDADSVYSMTNSLAEQLEKEGKFAVRIFGGPDPYSVIRDAKAISGGGKKEGMTPDAYLDLMSQWHKINKDMVEYITSKPRTGSKSSPITIDHQDDGHLMTGAEDHQQAPMLSEKTLQVGIPSQSSSAMQESRADRLDSAISPKTISKAADMSIASPPVIPVGHKGRSQSTPGLWANNDLTLAGLDTRPPQPMLTFPRPLNSKRVPPPPETPPPSTPPPPAASNSHPLSRIPPPLPASSVPRPASVQPPATSTSTSTTSYTNPSIAIPVAIVPHFQLTTVDAGSISMPINDGFSPPAHWQWFATLWRGSVGPDITIIIRGMDEELAEGVDTVKQTPIQANHASVLGGAHGNTGAGRDRISSVASSQSHTSGTGPVEIRLHDARAVIVKTGMVGSNASSTLNMVAGEDVKGTNKTLTGAQLTKEMENWGKAKRRVGFEVEEFLRR